MIQTASNVEINELSLGLEPYKSYFSTQNGIVHFVNNFSDASSFRGGISIAVPFGSSSYRESNLPLGKRVYDLFVQDNLLFATSGNTLTVAEINESGELQKRSEWQSTGDLGWIATLDNQLFMSSGFDHDQAYQFDLSTPQNPTLFYEQEIEHLGEQNAFKDGLYVSSGWFTGLQFYDVSSAPWQQIIRYQDGPKRSIESIWHMQLLENNLLAIMDGDLAILDIQDLQDIKILGTIGESFEFDSFVANDEMLFGWSRGAEFWGIQVIAIMNPTRSETIATWPDPSRSQIINWLLAKDNIYLLTKSCQDNIDNTLLRILDVSDPHDILLDASVCLTGRQTTLNLSDQRLFIGGENLVLLDVSDTKRPFSIAQISTPGTVLRLAVMDNFAYVADDEGGLLILRHD